MTRVFCPNCGVEMSAATVSSPAPCHRCLLASALADLPRDTETRAHDLRALLMHRALPAAVKFHAFGAYELIEEIGRGGMGVVFRARQTTLNRSVALKMISAEVDIAAALGQFRAEAEAVARLDHPHIVPLYEIGEHEGLHYFTMKWLAGGSLAEAIARRRLTPREAVTCLLTVTKAVQHAHERGVIHRDLKPGNILLDPAGVPHVTDFGLVKFLSDSGLPRGKAGGTAGYAAPEQLQGDTAITPAVDIFSLGVILHELLTGALPSHRLKHDQSRPGPEPQLPSLRAAGMDADLAAICWQCLRTDPAERYRSAASLAQDLERWLRNEPVSVRRGTVTEVVRRWIRRRPALSAAIGLVVLLGAAIPLLIAKIDEAKAENRQFVSSVRAEKVRELQMLRREWATLEVPFVTVSAELREEIWKARSSAPVPPGDGERFVVGIYAHEKPIETAGQFAPLLAWLETELIAARSNRVRLDLRVYKDNRAARLALVHGAVDVVRLGAGPFYKAAEELAARGERAAVLVRPKPGRYAATLFAHAQSGIHSVADLRGRSLALGDPESTISGFFVPAHLSAAGLDGGALRFQFHGSHTEALKEVLRGRFEAGVAKEGLFEKEHARGSPIIALTNIVCTGMPWVARSGLPADLVAEICASLLKLSRPDILSLLPDAPLEGFERAEESDYLSIADEYRHAERFFAGSHPEGARAQVGSDDPVKGGAP